MRGIEELIDPCADIYWLQMDNTGRQELDRKVEIRH